MQCNNSNLINTIKRLKKMTNIIFVSHEDETIPSGVITILEELFEIWPNKYQITFFF